ncbi:putative endolysin [Pseudomonas phage Lu11]|uniref:putative endolysin n=1 Tax=Pseudomonas phage Lu11 TaxID=1161927 RepID=UPI00025F1512|nr:putative endolysin [Pseudomonas phage Lu11]AFH14587.1 putative endolysin [Pseudomonas phage Lu11]
MAALEELDKIVDRHGSQKAPEKSRVGGESRPRLMQHAHIRADEEDVKFSEQKKHAYTAGAGGKKSNVSTSSQDKQADAIDGQTQVIKSQAVATRQQSNLLMQQSGLMQEQIQATRDISDVVERLAEFMKREATKPVPKVQERKGNTYEGEFKRVDNGPTPAERQRSLLDEMRQKRRDIARDRASRQPRDKRGRFMRNAPKPKLQGIGGRLVGMGGRLAGGSALLPLLTLGVGLFGGKVIEAMRENHVYEKKDAGMLSRGWQNTKDWLNDHKPFEDPNNTMLDQMTAKGKAKGVAIGQTAMHEDFGAIAAKFESGGRGVGTISSGKGDPGGVSYGAHQLNSKKGGMTNFLRSGEGSKYYNEFRGLTPGSEEFSKKYKEVVERDGKGMEQAQKAFIKRENYDPLAKWFMKQYDVDISQRSRALQEAFYSVATQYGPGKAKGLMGDTFGNRDISKMDDAEMITRIQEMRAASVREKFPGASADQQDGIFRRAGEEKAALLAMLNEEKQGPGSAAQVGSGIGSQYSSQMIGAYGGKQQGGGMQPASNGTVGIMAMPAAGGGGQQGGGGGGGSSDEAGGGTAASELNPADGALYALGQKHVSLNSSNVNMAGLNPKFKQAFYTMVGDWVQNNSGGTVHVESAFRTRMEQEALWVKYGRNTKRVARPGTSRHESGFAIDIDRKSAQSLETTGMFKKYGFHRPLSNEPWHVEMIRAGGGNKGGGGVSTESGGSSPQVMQAAVAKEMDKSTEVAKKGAEENTKGGVEAAPRGPTGGLLKTDPTGTGVSTSPESSGTSTMGGGEKKPEDAAANRDASGGLIKPETEGNPVEKKDEKADGETKVMSVEKTPPMVDAMDPTAPRTKEQQALYDLHMQQQNGTLTPGQVPVRKTGPGSAANPIRMRTAETSPSQGKRISGNIKLNPFGKAATPTDPTTRAITREVTRIGQRAGWGSMGGVPGEVNGKLGEINSKISRAIGGSEVGRELMRIPGVSGMIPRLSSGLPSFGDVVNGAAGIATNIFGGDSKVEPAQKSTPVMGQPGMRSTPTGDYVLSTEDLYKPKEVGSVNSLTPETSPASPSYYSNDTPVVSRAAPVTAPMPVSTAPMTEPVQRDDFSSVQQVSLSPDSAPAAAPSAPAMGGGGGKGGGGKGGGKNDMPQLDDLTPVVNDLGILFPLSGLV